MPVGVPFPHHKIFSPLTPSFHHKIQIFTNLHTIPKNPHFDFVSHFGNPQAYQQKQNFLTIFSNQNLPIFPLPISKIPIKINHLYELHLSSTKILSKTHSKFTTYHPNIPTPLPSNTLPIPSKTSYIPTITRTIINHHPAKQTPNFPKLSSNSKCSKHDHKHKITQQKKSRYVQPFIIHNNSNSILFHLI